MSVAAYAWNYSSVHCFADNNKVVNNSIKSVNGDTGIAVGAYDLSGSFTASSNNNKVIRNVIDGFQQNIDEEGTATKVHANVYE